MGLGHLGVPQVAPESQRQSAQLRRSRGLLVHTMVHTYVRRVEGPGGAAVRSKIFKSNQFS